MSWNCWDWFHSKKLWKDNVYIGLASLNRRRLFFLNFIVYFFLFNTLNIICDIRRYQTENKIRNAKCEANFDSAQSIRFHQRRRKSQKRRKICKRLIAASRWLLHQSFRGFLLQRYFALNTNSKNPLAPDIFLRLFGC